ncbi:hypothetical protein OFM39_28070, partial [Escherichia coli]|nr:hypothetical protein [Escherichia coli]
LESNNYEDTELANYIAWLTYNLGQVMKRLNMSFSGGIQQCVPQTLQNTRSYNSPRRSKGIQRREYE